MLHQIVSCTRFVSVKIQQDAFCGPDVLPGRSHADHVESPRLCLLLLGRLLWQLERETVNQHVCACGHRHLLHTQYTKNHGQAQRKASM